MTTATGGGAIRAPAAVASSELRTNFTAARLSVSWFGVRKTLTPDQKALAADTFGAEGPYLSAAKKLLDTRDPAYKAVTAVRGRAVGLWRAMSLPYPDPGVRLIRREDVGNFNEGMAALRRELDDAVAALEGSYGALRESARLRLGRLYDDADYPRKLLGLFAIDWDFPSVEPPEYLSRLNPELYEQERRRIASRFDEAVKLAERAFTEELAKLVEHMTERLSGEGPDGKPKVFRDSAVSNLREFFERFRGLSVRSNAELDQLVETASRAVAGVDPEHLRENAPLRQRVASQLSAVAASLDQMLVDRPRRRILRAAPTSESR